MKKGGFLRNVLDTIRSNQTGPPSGSSTGPGGGQTGAVEFGGLLKPQHFALNQVARHGFPDGPTALAFDPVQKIAAIGTKTGALRVFGRPGVDVWAQHKPELAVTHIKFIINQGAIITVTADDSIHLWSLRGPNLKLQLSQAGSTGGASSPGQLSHSPVPAGSGGPATAAIATHAAHHRISDTGAQPGDPDYLMEGGAHQVSHAGPDGGAAGGKSRESRQPEILHTLKFQRERITCLHQTLMSKWLYIGTERGNVHVANVETFELSGYTIPWNKAIELSRKTHPGSIIHLSECPQDTNKLLIGYESGCIVLWDLKQRIAEGRYYHTENLLWLAWHYEGKQFVAAHGDGSLITWQTRSNARPAQVLHPHAKSGGGSGAGDLGAEQQPNQQQQQSMASTFARAFNNELYRPINKVEWKTSKTTNEQFLLFSGGLPYDGLMAGEPSNDPERRQQQQKPGGSGPPSRQSMGPSPSGGGGPLQVRPTAMTAFQNSQQSQQQQQQHLKASSASPNFADTNPSPGAIASPSFTPSGGGGGGSLSSQQAAAATKQPTMGNHKERKSLRSTSLTVMYGKSITVLEMDETIIDFITVCDLSPHENDASDPFAVLVLLSNDLILIDLTSSGYPSFESPYPSQALNESPVTCVQYLADCSSDLIPFLYSTSQNVVSRVPKKGFSDKEWPINGGEWGQPMQSYPELVITGHADGTIKFWDMSGVNFDLISKIKTSKLFDRPNRLPNSQIIPFNQLAALSSRQQRGKQQSATPGEPIGCSSTSDYASCATSYSAIGDSTATLGTGPVNDLGSCPWSLMENCFAIERIEYCSASRHLLVAGALSQVIQFKLNKKDSPPSASEVIIVDPVASVQPTAVSGGAAGGASEPPSSAGANSNQSKRPQQHHLVLRARSLQATPANSTGSTSGGSSSSSAAVTASASSAAQRPRPMPGFQADLVCITPLLVTSTSDLDLGGPGTSTGAASAGSSPINPALSLVAPPRVTALTVQAQHNILAYAHEQGVVLVDLVQKCVIMNASLADLYGTMSSSRDPSIPPPIQPFATSSILQHHYQTTGVGSGPSEYIITANKLHHNSGLTTGGADNGGGGGTTSLGNSAASAFSQFDSARELGDNSLSSSSSLYKSGAPNEATNAPTVGQTQSRHTANSMFQRQLSTTALLSSATSSGAGQSASGTATPPARPSTAAGGPRLFQRQMTAAQLFSSGGGGGPGAQQAADNKQRAAALVASARGSDLAGSVASLGSGAEARQHLLRSPRRGEQPGAAGAKTTNKRIISRMLSISAIHTSGAGSGGSGGSASGSQDEHQQDAASACSPSGADQAPDKLDSSFTRSRSSSSGSVAASASLEQAEAESIQCLCLVDWTQATCAAHSSPNNKSPTPIGACQQLALWLGTSQGSVLLVSLQMPDSEDNRVLQLQSVLAEPQPQAAQKLPGAILELAAFQLEALKAPPGGSSASSLESPDSSSSPTAASTSGGQPQDSNGGSGPGESSRPPLACHFLAVVSEREARVHQIPPAQHQEPQQLNRAAAAAAAGTQPEAAGHHHHHHHHHQQVSTGAGGAAVQAMASLLTSKSAAYSRTPLADSSFACRSALVWLRPPSSSGHQQEEPCLVSYLANGNLRVHSLPKLRLLLDADFVPFTSRQLARSMEFSRQAHCLYRPSPGEIGKFSLSAQYGALVNDMAGTLFVPREMPEQPRANFFKSLFSSVSGAGAVIGGRQTSDRDELFGECAKGSSARSVAVAKHLGANAPAGFEKLKSAAVGTMGHDMRMAREGLDERGEKLSDLEDRTLQMMNQSENYAQAAHQLAQKFKDKKWYQF